MRLSLQEFVEKIIARAHYEYDNSVKQWAAWIDDFPGVYAQGKRVEEVRQELALTLEEHLLFSIRERKKIPGFVFPVKSHAKIA